MERHWTYRPFLKFMADQRLVDTLKRKQPDEMIVGLFSFNQIRVTPRLSASPPPYGRISPANHVPAETQPLSEPPQPWLT